MIPHETEPSPNAAGSVRFRWNRLPFFGGLVSACFAALALPPLSSRLFAWFALVPLFLSWNRHAENARMRAVHGAVFGIAFGAWAVGQQAESAGEAIGAVAVFTGSWAAFGALLGPALRMPVLGYLALAGAALAGWDYFLADTIARRLPWFPLAALFDPGAREAQAAAWGGRALPAAFAVLFAAAAGGVFRTRFSVRVLAATALFAFGFPWIAGGIVQPERASHGNAHRYAVIHSNEAGGRGAADFLEEAFLTALASSRPEVALLGFPPGEGEAGEAQARRIAAALGAVVVYPEGREACTVWLEEDENAPPGTTAQENGPPPTALIRTPVPALAPTPWGSAGVLERRDLERSGPARALARLGVPFLAAIGPGAPLTDLGARIAARIRALCAVETRRAVIEVGGGGLAQVRDSRGRLLASSPPGLPWAAADSVPLTPFSSLATRGGWWVGPVLTGGAFLYAVAAIGFWLRARRKPPAAAHPAG